MKKIILLSVFFTLPFVFTSCNTELIDETTNTLESKSSSTMKNNKLTGFDEWGFNWQAQQFNGYVINMLLGDHYFEGWPHYKQDIYNGEGEAFWDTMVLNYDYFSYLMPKELLDAKINAHWNDGLISKDGVYPESWVDAKAWIIFKYSGKVNNIAWFHTRKLVSSKSTDTLMNGIWYNEEGEEIGFESMYFPELIVIQVINNGDIPPFFYDEYNTPWGPGYGHFKKS